MQKIYVVQMRQVKTRNCHEMTGIYNAIEVKVLDQFQPCRSKTGANNHKRGITCQMSMPDDNVIV